MGFKGFKKNFNECLRVVSKVCQVNFKGLSRKIEEGSERPLSKIKGNFKGYLKEVQRVFQGSL